MITGAADSPPKEPEPIFFPILYLPPTRRSILKMLLSSLNEKPVGVR